MVVRQGCLQNKLELGEQLQARVSGIRPLRGRDTLQRRTGVRGIPRRRMAEGLGTSKREGSKKIGHCTAPVAGTEPGCGGGKRPYRRAPRVVVPGIASCCWDWHSLPWGKSRRRDQQQKSD